MDLLWIGGHLVCTAAVPVFHHFVGQRQSFVCADCVCGPVLFQRIQLDMDTVYKLLLSEVVLHRRFIVVVHIIDKIPL